MIVPWVVTNVLYNVCLDHTIIALFQSSQAKEQRVAGEILAIPPSQLSICSIFCVYTFPSCLPLVYCSCLFAFWAYVAGISCARNRTWVKILRTRCYYSSESKKKNCVRLRLILVLVGKNLCVCSPNFGFSATTVWYQVRIMYQMRMYLVSAGRNLYVRTWWYA